MACSPKLLLPRIIQATRDIVKTHVFPLSAAAVSPLVDLLDRLGMADGWLDIKFFFELKKYFA
jgi:hypothetical protein